MVIKPRSAAGIAAIWLVAVLGVSATAWVAIDRAGRDLTDVSVTTLSAGPLTTPALGPQPTTTTPQERPGAAASPTPQHPAIPTPATPTPAPAPATTAVPAPADAATAQEHTISVNGGIVSAGCTGTAIQLRFAQPADGWRVDVTSRPGQIYVSFQSDDDENQARTQVSAVCTAGSARFTVTSG